MSSNSSDSDDSTDISDRDIYAVVDDGGNIGATDETKNLPSFHDGLQIIKNKAYDTIADTPLDGGTYFIIAATADRPVSVQMVPSQNHIALTPTGFSVENATPRVEVRTDNAILNTVTNNNIVVTDSGSVINNILSVPVEETDSNVYEIDTDEFTIDDCISEINESSHREIPTGNQSTEDTNRYLYGRSSSYATYTPLGNAALESHGTTLTIPWQDGDALLNQENETSIRDRQHGLHVRYAEYVDEETVADHIGLHRDGDTITGAVLDPLQ